MLCPIFKTTILKQLNNQLLNMTKPKVTNKQAAKTHKAMLSERKQGLRNPYAHCLLDPEHGPIMGVPDEFPHKTHKARIITQRALEFDSNGRASAVIGSSLDRFVTQETVTGTGVRSLKYDIGSDGTAISTESWHDELRNATSAAGTFQSDYTMGPYYYDNDNTGTNDFAHNKEIETLLISVADGLPAGATGAVLIEVINVENSATIRILAYTSDTTANAWGFQVTTYAVGGNETVTTYGPFTGTGSFVDQTVTLPASADFLSNIRCYRLTGSGVLTGFRSTFATLGKKQVASPIGREDGTDLGLIKAGAKRVRVVSMSCWAMYNGSMTSNGLITCGQIPHADLANLPILTSEELANLPGFYSGPLNKGGYAWMRPLDRVDLAFDDVSNPDGYGSRLAVAVRANDADAQNVTLRVCAVVEFQTDNQVWGASRNIVDPPMIWNAQKELAQFPTGMENDLHLKQIAKKMVEIGKKAAHFVQTYGPYALSALQAAESLV
jgi:hypothetical protein